MFLRRLPIHEEKYVRKAARRTGKSFARNSDARSVAQTGGAAYQANART
jgi:hypothetical protein